jgi:hypothetical protein
MKPLEMGLATLKAERELDAEQTTDNSYAAAI